MMKNDRRFTWPSLAAFIKSRMVFQILIFLLTMLGTCVNLHAASVMISWDPNPESDIAGYKLYKRALPSQDFGQPIFSGLPGTPSSPSTIVTGLSDGTTYGFMLTAFDTSGNESAPSLEKQITLPTVTPQPQPLDRTAWVVWVDSEEPDSPGRNAIDGTTATFWHTGWRNGSTPHPHSLQVNLGGVYAIGGIRYTPRDAFYGANGRIGQYEVYVASNTGTPPTIPPVLSQWTKVASGTFPNTTTEQQVLFSAIPGQYIWLRVLSEAQGKGYPWTAVGEFTVLGTLE